MASKAVKVDYRNARFLASYKAPGQLPASRAPEVSFVGRSNVGKSSLMNALFQRKTLVKVSKRPGATQAANFFEVGQADFVDLPGYGFAQVPLEEKRKWERLIEGYFTQDRMRALCVLLVDIRHDANKLDLQMVDYLVGNDVPFIIAFTKADKLSKAAQLRQVRSLCRQFPAAGDAVALACSATSGQGVGDLKEVIDDAVLQCAEASEGGDR